jgi:PIN domain nuclease of toxin-antitoxin system
VGGKDVKHLLDTGGWVRAVNQPHTIPAGVLRVLQAPHERFGLAAISLWEGGKKVQVGYFKPKIKMG